VTEVNVCVKVGPRRLAAKVKVGPDRVHSVLGGPPIGPDPKPYIFFGKTWRLVREKLYLCGFWTQIWSGFAIGPLRQLSGVLVKVVWSCILCERQVTGKIWYRRKGTPSERVRSHTEIKLVGAVQIRKMPRRDGGECMREAGHPLDCSATIG